MAKSNAQGKRSSSKYTELIIYAVLFVLLVTGIFIVNLIIARSGQQEAKLINIVGQQRAFAAIAAKGLMELRLNEIQGRPTEATFKEASNAYHQFDTTLVALKSGGKIPNLFDQSKPIGEISPIVEPVAREILLSSAKTWDDYKGTIDFYFIFLESKQQVDSVTVATINEFASRQSLTIFNDMDKLGARLEELASQRNAQLRNIQTAAAILIATLFVLAGIRVAYSLRRQDNIIRESQTALVQNEKLATLGQMVAGLAHEMNTPLGFVRSNIEMIIENQKEVQETIRTYLDVSRLIKEGAKEEVKVKFTEANEKADKIEQDGIVEESEIMLDSSIQGLDRIQELVANLKNFSRVDETETKLTDINKSLDSTLVIAYHITKQTATIEKDYGEIPEVPCYPAQLNQVFLNIITNAAQAMTKGNIRVSTRLEGKDVRISIADNGMGIPEENLAKVFDPFFTTKEIGKGTGLGLSIVKQIIDKHNGRIAVKSKVGKGTEFIIHLPIGSDKAVAQRASKPAEAVV
jgi:two-component system NtrC family sensor kinase